MSENGDKELSIYEVTNRTTGLKSYQPATNAQDACKQAGWLIDDCFIVQERVTRRRGSGDTPLALVKIPCQTCPFQYVECKKPDDLDCPTRPSAPELQNWMKQAAEAHLCSFVGEDLTKKNHQLQQKWVTIEEAVKELSAKS